MDLHLKKSTTLWVDLKFYQIVIDLPHSLQINVEKLTVFVVTAHHGLFGILLPILQVFKTQNHAKAFEAFLKHFYKLAL